MSLRPIRDTLFAFRTAHEIIWKHGHWKYLLLPIILAALLLPVLGVLIVGLSYLLAGWVEGWFSSSENAWIRYGVLLALLSGNIGIGYVLYRNLIMVCYGPFLDRLTMEAEKQVNGFAEESERPLWKTLTRPLVITVYAVIASSGTILLGFLLGLVPIVGGLLLFLFIVPTQLFLGAIGYVDPYLEQKGYSPRNSIQLMRHHLKPMLVFAAFGFLLLCIPVAGWFIAPTYSAIAGIVLAIRMHANQSSTVDV